MTKKIQVSFSDKQFQLLTKLRGELGDTDSDVVRSIVIAWLAEKSFISTTLKERLFPTGSAVSNHIRNDQTSPIE